MWEAANLFFTVGVHLFDILSMYFAMLLGMHYLE